MKCDKSQKSKVHRLRPVTGGGKTVPNVEEVFGKKGLGEGFVVYLYAFADGSEMRRGVEADFGQARRVLREDGGNERTGGALSLGSSDMDGTDCVEVRWL